MAKKLKQKEEKTESEETKVELSIEVPEDGIGGRIRSARESRGFSQTAVAVRSKLVDPNKRGVARTVLVGYESGQFKPGAREIRILCEVLSITPNWLIYGDDSAFEAEQVSMEVVRKTDLQSAFSIAFAISVLKSHEKGAFKSLVLSMAGRELGDLRLSGLMFLSRSLADSAMKELTEFMGTEILASDSVELTLDKLVKKWGEGMDTNWGNKLSFGEDGEGPVTGEWLYPEPKK